MIEELAEKLIRKRITEGTYFITTHAHERMAEREIEEDIVLDCILNGQPIEFQKSKTTGDVKVLFQEAALKRPELYVVVAAVDTPVIITVCRTTDEAWECVDNVLRRRG